MSTEALISTQLEDSKLLEIRASVPVLSEVVYLNTGTAGPMPTAVTEAIRAEATAQLGTPRIGPDHGLRVRELKSQTREALASMLGCASTEVALTHNTTEGMNLATLGINWQAGDEAVTTNAEHPGALYPLYAAQDRFNITIKTANVVNKSPEEIVETIEARCTSRTKLISLSHVAFTTGQLLPIREIAEVAHRHGALLLVDGAQSFGSLALDMAQLGCDMFAGSGQKWLCGPEGTGVLYVSQDVISQTRITFAGYGTMEGHNDYGGYQVKGNAQRFEQGTADSIGFAGQLAAARWLTDTVGLPVVYERTRQLTDFAIARLSEEPGIEILTPAQHAGLVARIAGVEPDAVVEHLRNQKILIRSVRSVGAIRLSLGFFNTEDEIELAISEIVAAPRSVPN